MEDTPFVQRLREKLAGEDLAKATKRLTVQDACAFATWWRGSTGQELDPDDLSIVSVDLAEYRSYLMQRNFRPSTIQRKFYSLRTALRLVDPDHFASLRWPKLPKVVRPDLVRHAMEKVFVAKRGIRLILRVEARAPTYQEAERRLWAGLRGGGSGGMSSCVRDSSSGLQRSPLAAGFGAPFSSFAAGLAPSMGLRRLAAFGGAHRGPATIPDFAATLGALRCSLHLLHFRAMGLLLACDMFSVLAVACSDFSVVNCTASFWSHSSMSSFAALGYSAEDDGCAALVQHILLETLLDRTGCGGYGKAFG